jgi:D-alanyl-D-alanine carboxypeptidase
MEPMAILLLLLALAAPSAADAPVDSLHRLPADFRPEDLVEIPVPPAVRPGLLLRAPALRALLEMVEAAADSSVHLRVVSAYRSWDRQAALYERARERHGPDQAWVAPPGASEHQLGTTVDLADAALEQVLEPGFAETAEGLWVRRHCAAYGFRISYTPADSGAYRPEPWHLRWMEPAPADSLPGAP